MKILLSFLRDKTLDGIDVDSVERINIHKKILLNKPLLKKVFTEFHERFKLIANQKFCVDGSEIEIGAGVYPVKYTYGEVLATDLVNGEGIDLELNAEDMSALSDSSVRVLYGQNCFHHFPHPDKFFEEAIRVLKPGGGFILIEPYYGIFAKFLYKRLFKTEGFDMNYTSWEIPSTGPMNGANQALSYIVFIRDRKIFEKKYPQLKIVEQDICNNYLKYLISGGLNFKQLCPNWMIPIINIVQWCLIPFNKVFGLHHFIVVKKG